MTTPAFFADVPIPVRLATIGGAFAGACGSALGLLLGVRAYPPTAWFAVFEVGVPAAVGGAVLGLVVGAVVSATNRVGGQSTSKEE